jgi:hypothetical protein
MQTVLHHPDVLDAVTAFEPCDEFRSDDGAPACAVCGWLDDEHPAPGLSAAPPAWAGPRERLAS